MKSIAILGSTGSIGRQTLDVVKDDPEIRVVGLAAGGGRTDLLEEQARIFMPRLVAVYDEAAAKDLKTRLADTEISVTSGMEGLIALAEMTESELLVTAIVGMIGILPTVAAIRAGKDIALANKETLVTAGEIIMPLAREQQVKILPVDSEHSAIFQCLQGAVDPPKRILLTASGGPFCGRKKDELACVTREDALRHPNWSMGEKITVDSATLVNKGLEVMEARHLFGVDLSAIEVIIHPESAIHSMVEFEDGAVIAQIGTPDMRLPIEYALKYPHRRAFGGESLDFFALGAMHFEKPDTETFRGLALARDASMQGGSMPTVFNAANEEAVARFLAGRIRFLDIYEIIEEAMLAHRIIEAPDIGAILETEQAVRAAIQERW